MISSMEKDFSQRSPFVLLYINNFGIETNSEFVLRTKCLIAAAFGDIVTYFSASHGKIESELGGPGIMENSKNLYKFL